MRNITPYIDRKIRIMPPVPVLNAGLRKKRMSSIGSSTRSSHSTNRVSTTAADRERDQRRGAAPAVLRAPRSVRRRATRCRRSTAPRRPGRAGPAPGPSTSARGTSRRRARSAGSGTLTRKTEPYQKCPSSQPLATGPMAPAAPVTLAQIAMALVRSSGGKTLTRIDSVDGMMNAAPTPITARQAMSCHMASDTRRQDAGDQVDAPGRTAARPCARSGRRARRSRTAARRTRASRPR